MQPIGRWALIKEENMSEDQREAAPSYPGSGPTIPAVTEEDVLEAMRDVIDPELGINVLEPRWWRC